MYPTFLFHLIIIILIIIILILILFILTLILVTFISFSLFLISSLLFSSFLSSLLFFSISLSASKHTSAQFWFERSTGQTPYPSIRSIQWRRPAVYKRQNIRDHDACMYTTNNADRQAFIWQTQLLQFLTFFIGKSSGYGVRTEERTIVYIAGWK